MADACAPLDGIRSSDESCSTPASRRDPAKASVWRRLLLARRAARLHNGANNGKGPVEAHSIVVDSMTLGRQEELAASRPVTRYPPV